MVFLPLTITPNFTRSLLGKDLYMNAFRITKLNTIFRILFLSSICVISASAQRPAATPANEPVPDRISFGLRGGVLFSGLVNNADSTQATSATSPPTISTTTVNSQSWRGAIGGTIRYDLSEKIDIGADVLFRRAGYDTEINLYTQDDGEIDDLIEGRTEQTKADFWDVPILARYYTKARSDEGSRPFFTGGIAFRSAGCCGDSLRSGSGSGCSRWSIRAERGCSAAS
jgi:hypothetical protein